MLPLFYHIFPKPWRYIFLKAYRLRHGIQTNTFFQSDSPAKEKRNIINKLRNEQLNLILFSAWTSKRGHFHLVTHLDTLLFRYFTTFSRLFLFYDFCNTP